MQRRRLVMDGRLRRSSQFLSVFVDQHHQFLGAVGRSFRRLLFLPE